jgi:hypothetical protein
MGIPLLGGPGPGRSWLAALGSNRIGRLWKSHAMAVASGTAVKVSSGVRIDPRELGWLMSQLR